MRVVPCVVGVILLVINTNEFSLESLDDFLVYPVEVPTSIQKRDTWKDESMKTFDKFVEEKLVAHSQALEHILDMTRSNQEYIKQLIENQSNKVSEPKMPEKVEVQHQSRRSYVDIDNDNPFVMIGKNIPKYGNLFKDMVLKEFEQEDDPKTLVEHSVFSDAKTTASAD